MLRRPLLALRPPAGGLHPRRCMAAKASAPPHTLNPKGKNTSLWMSRNTASAAIYPSLRATGDEKFDVIVVGGGITGLTSALNLKRAGLRVAVLEHHHIGSGTTGNSTGHISLHIDQDYNTIERNFGTDSTALVYKGQVEARDEIERNCRELNIPGYEGPIDAWLYSEAGQPRSEIFQEYETLRRIGVPGVELVPDKSSIGLPYIPDVALKIPGSAQFDSHRYCQGLAKAVHGNGSAVFENTRVFDVKDGEPCEVHTEQGVLRARDVISATHVPLGISVLQTAMVPYLSFVIAVRVPQPFPAGLFYDTLEPYHYLRRLDADNPNVVIVGGEDKKTGEHKPRENECFDALRRFTWARFKAPQEIACWSSQLFESADGAPYVGTDPGSSHVWVATGYSGDGLSLGTVSARILSQSILGQKHPLASVYSSHRFKPVASAKHFLQEQMSVAKHMVVDRIKSGEQGPLQDLEPGQGRVAQVGAHKVAAYRDTDGRLHAHSAVCTHMKCIVNWNASEKTFDCPCHGSRFSVEGKVLEGPALSDLPDVLEEAAGTTTQRGHTKESIAERMSRM